MDKDSVFQEIHPEAAISGGEMFIPTTLSEQNALESIFELLFMTTHVDFSHYRRNTIFRRLTRRMTFSKQNSFVEYLHFIRDNPNEVHILYDDFLLSYTEFFRDPGVFDVLKNQIFPRLVENCSNNESIRFWIPGCSTGEEVYSFAICYQEYLRARNDKANHNKVQFFGTDLNARHLDIARSAIYPANVREHFSDEMLGQYFEQNQEGLKITKHIREMCVFAIQNITQDPPFSRIDFISCRNVLIYFDTAYQEAVFPLFHFALRDGGLLLLGLSESLGKFPDLFSLVDQKINLYTKRALPVKMAYRIPVNQFKSEPQEENIQILMTTTNKKNYGDIGSQIDKILLDAYTPPCILVDSNLLIRQFRGRVFSFFEPVTGEASWKLAKIVGDELIPELYVAIEEARRKRTKVKKKAVSFVCSEEVNTIDITIVPVQLHCTEELYFLIIFEKLDDAFCNANNNSSPVYESAYDQTDTLQQVRNELQSVKRYLQSIIEEKDKVNQELWVANEEVQSANEELQSINEEMEAAKEELESSNEELVTLNEELQLKNNELKQAKDFSENVIETAKAIVVLLDIKGRIVLLNNYTEQLTGYKKEEITGKNWFDIFIPRQRHSRLSTVFENVLQRMPEVAQFENKIITKNGEVKLIRWSNSVLRDADGAINGVLSIGMDVTVYRKIEKTLKESEEKYRSLVETSQDLIWQCNSARRFTYLNPAWEHTLGYGLPDMLEREFNGFLSPSVAGSTLRELESVYKGCRLKGYETILVDKSGKEIHLVLHAVAVRSPSGRYAGIRGTAHNITDRKLAEQMHLEFKQQQQQAQRLESLGILAGGIAHDFNNLLGGIFAFIDLASQESQNNMKAAHYLKTALLTIERARSLTQQLLTFAKGGAPVLQVGSLFPAVQETVQFALSGSNISCCYDFQPDLWSCNFDKNQISQVIENLIINAQQAMPAGGSIDLSARNVMLKKDEHRLLSEGNYICISVKDYGIGISEELVTRIFDPFFTTKTKGHGLGLATSYSIVNRHGGCIDVESQPGKGSVFHVFLPACKSIPSSSVVEPSKKHKGEGTFLIMDDEEAIRKAIEAMLTSFGYSVVSRNNGRDALTYFHETLKTGIHLCGIIFDLTIPGGMGGREVISEIRKIDKSLPVFVSSGYAEDPVMASPAEYGFTASIAKPFRIIDLSKLLNTYLSS